MKFKDLIYAITCLSFAVVIGAAVYEHLAVVPKWSMAPPASLTMFQGPYGLNAQAFWIPIHPITMLLFLATLIVSWKTERKNAVATAFIGYLVVIAVTAIYFVPELIAITTTPYLDVIDSDLMNRAQMWESLSLLRLGVLIILSLTLFLGLAKSKEANTYQLYVR